ncbi:DNA-3-methyladenine glycosylase [Haloechinothrix sp. LS1_15]|uniref:DNA-3-methyladenine glycosylase n=1 Tax=Haloechinothrix sp. LS1_15 TaxID=2652248 RepID=UPI002946EC39|nr:DNA-3-methyladenine glycosylase [Haloechinothrix sp. LS1_15]MDV6012273.1 DNA-3-methyladenine glycosylase [Haloechinothrix sp. LS1_15]
MHTSPAQRDSPRLARDELAVDPVDACPVLLGSVIEADTPGGTVAARVVEVEAYRGGDDPASHAFRGRTARNAVMWGPAGYLYVYLIYGMHHCLNVVCLDDGVAGAVLLRAGEIVAGERLARSRRRAARSDDELGRGPARLASALGLTVEHNNTDLTAPRTAVRLYAGDTIPADQVRSGGRVGVSVAADVPWRFWVDGSRAVSAYRPGGGRSRGAG